MSSKIKMSRGFFFFYYVKHFFGGFSRVSEAPYKEIMRSKVIDVVEILYDHCTSRVGIIVYMYSIHGGC